MGRVLCVDYGRRRIGLAVSDALGRTAQPLEVIERTKRGSALEAVCEVARTVEAEEIVVGLPLRLDGSPGAAAQAAGQFADALRERSGLPVTLWDERLSTTEAAREMRASGVADRAQRGVVDKIAAAVILRAYLESRNHEGLVPDDAVLPEPVPEPPHRREPPSGDAGERRRGARRRRNEERDSGRREWRQDLDDL